MLGLQHTKKEIMIMNYQIGPWQFIESRCVVVAENIERELDPLLVKLLMHFISKPQQIIARQELVEQVWRQSFVDDNAINRAISELRKQLSHPVEKAPLLKTHYRKGYSLSVAVTLLTATELTTTEQAKIGLPSKTAIKESLDSKNVGSTVIETLTEHNNLESLDVVKSNKSKQYGLYGLVLIIFFTLTVIGWFVIQKPVKSEDIAQFSVINTSTKITPSTWNIGAESVPLLSFDKQFLGYSNSDMMTQQSRAYVKRITDQREIQLDYKDYDVSILSWQHKQHSVLLQATKLAEQQCLMVLIDLHEFPNVGSKQVIRDCDLRYTGYAQLDESGKFLYYSEYKNKQGGAGLYRYNTFSKQETTLVPSSEVMFGVLIPRISPSGKYVGYIQATQGQPFSLFAYNLQTTETKRLFQAEAKSISFAFDWIPDEESVHISENDRLTTVNIADNKTTVRKISPYISPYYIAAQSLNSFYFSPSQTQQFSIFKVTDLFSQKMQGQRLYESQGNNYNAAPFNKDGYASTLFVSSRSGSAQLWSDTQGQQTQLSDFTVEHGTPSFGFVRMSGNDKFLLLKINKELTFFDLQTNKLHAVEELKGLKIVSYAWSDNSEKIWFIEQQATSYQLWQFNLLTRELNKRNDIAPYTLINNNQGKSFAVTNEELVRLADNKRWQIPKAQQATSFHAINTEYLYISDGISRVARFNLANSETEEVHVNFKSFSFNVNDNNELLFNRRDVKDTQIKLVSW